MTSDNGMATLTVNGASAVLTYHPLECAIAQISSCQLWGMRAEAIGLLML
ncbi:MAG: hypothetical protein AAGA83_10545 [Cyanobacteria bacterium P01_F01_bin.116]